MKPGFQFLTKTFGSKTKAQEIILLLQDAKPVVRQGFYEPELVNIEKYCRENNLFLVKSKFKVLLADGQAYSNQGVRVSEKDKRGMYFIYLSKSEEKALAASYYELVEDHLNLGLLLGYPRCCVEFFCHNFHKENTDLELKPTNQWTNLSRRSKDCVLLSHFPCSSNCERSIELGKRYFAVLKEYDPGRAETIFRKLQEFAVRDNKPAVTWPHKP